MNPYSMMMAAAKENSKREVPRPIDPVPVVVHKKKLGRPPAAKKEPAELGLFLQMIRLEFHHQR
jgi:hypothetical protein